MSVDKMKLYVFDNGESHDDHNSTYILAPRNMKDDVALEIYRARNRSAGFIVLVTAKFEWRAPTGFDDRHPNAVVQRMETLAEYFGELGAHNSEQYEKLSKPAKRYLSRAWSVSADVKAAAAQSVSASAAANNNAPVNQHDKDSLAVAAMGLPNPNDKEAMAAWTAANIDGDGQIINYDGEPLKKPETKAAEIIEDF